MNASTHVSVLIAEDHTVVREGLRSLLATAPDIKVVGEASTGRQAVDLFKEIRPDVVLMDIAMPVLNGLEATREIQLEVPGARVLILSAHADDAYVERAVEAGAAGYLIKQSTAFTLMEAIRTVQRGGTYFSPSVHKRFLMRHQHNVNAHGRSKEVVTALTTREREVLQRIAEGEANKQIAFGLGISIKTVEKHREHLMRKLDIHDTAGITRYAIGAGIIESSVQFTLV